MKTNPENHKTCSTFLAITGLLVGLILMLTTLVSHAQFRLTYGAEAGLGTSRLTSGLVGYGSDYLSFKFEQPSERDLSLQLGGYACYYPASWLFV